MTTATKTKRQKAGQTTSKLPEFASVVVQIEHLVAGLKRVKHAVLTSDLARPALNAVLIEVYRDRLNVVAADGFMMASASMHYNLSQNLPAGKLQFLMPLKTAEAIIDSSYSNSSVRLVFNELARTDYVTSTIDTALTLTFEALFADGYRRGGPGKAALARAELLSKPLQAVIATAYPDWERIAPTSGPTFWIEAEAGRLAARILNKIDMVEMTFRRMSGASVMALDYRYNIILSVDDRSKFAWLAAELHDVVKVVLAAPAAPDRLVSNFTADYMRPWLQAMPVNATVQLRVWETEAGKSGRPLVMNWTDPNGIEYQGITMPVSYGNAEFI